eukprot:Unigene8180_Nuclearia_a/m.25106 Unigene8180_Nuclearia_a/g.25106  ORF Unigene8180_Nuclearia_a/g.25106 Unigene8180_Nuclearia_a/m.25106 type:complete len:369 (+) Unigene8180_Nuclearia_a:652-1758(+)
MNTRVLLARSFISDTSSKALPLPDEADDGRLRSSGTSTKPAPSSSDRSRAWRPRCRPDPSELSESVELYVARRGRVGVGGLPLSGVSVCTATAPASADLGVHGWKMYAWMRWKRSCVMRNTSGCTLSSNSSITGMPATGAALFISRRAILCRRKLIGCRVGLNGAMSSWKADSGRRLTMCTWSTSSMFLPEPSLALSRLNSTPCICSSMNVRRTSSAVAASDTCIAHTTWSSAHDSFSSTCALTVSWFGARMRLIASSSTTSDCLAAASSRLLTSSSSSSACSVSAVSSVADSASPWRARVANRSRLIDRLLLSSCRSCFCIARNDCVLRRIRPRCAWYSIVSMRPASCLRRGSRYSSRFWMTSKMML